MIEEQDDHGALEHAVEVLHASLEGWLRFGEQGVAVKYIVDPGTGRLIAPVPVAALLATDHTLLVPEDTDEALAMIVTPQKVEEGALTDRWCAYHGEPEHVRWAELWVESGKHGEWVFDGEGLTVVNPLTSGGEEAALIRRCNRDAGELAKVCQRFAGVVVPDPVCVGVDPRGLHVRARFGVVRVRFEGGGEAGGEIEALFSGV